MVVGLSPVAVTQTSDLAPFFSKQFLDIQATAEYGFTLKRVRDIMKTYSFTLFENMIFSEIEQKLKNLNSSKSFLELNIPNNIVHLTVIFYSHPK